MAREASRSGARRPGGRRIAVVFDLDDTLVAATAAMNRAIAESCAVCGLGAADLRRADRRLWPLVEAGSCSIPEYRLRRWVECGLDPARAAEVDAHFLKRFCDVRLRHGARRTLEALRARGHAIGVFTDRAADTQRAKLERVRLDPLIDVVAISEEIGVGKPDRRAFEAIAVALDSDPRDTVMVGNSYDLDIEAALAAGYRAGLWLTRNQRAVRNERIRRIRRLDEVPSLVQWAEALSQAHSESDRPLSSFESLRGSLSRRWPLIGNPGSDGSPSTTA